jgi:hypothetical protein
VVQQIESVVSFKKQKQEGRSANAKRQKLFDEVDEDPELDAL